MKKFLREHLPKRVLEVCSWIYHPSSHFKKLREKRHINNQIRKKQISYENKLKELHNKEGKIHCVFFALFNSVWKYDYVYKLLDKNPKFDVCILICPIINCGKEYMLQQMKECYDSMSRKGYKTFLSYNKNTNKYIDIHKDLNADIIFYTNPYKGLIDDRYYIDNIQDVLTIYVSYSFTQSNWHNINYASTFSALLWRFYQETDYHLNIAKSNSKIFGKNTVTTGYPGIDSFIDNSYKPTNIWKTNKKRIIWAPHHTIEPVGVVNYSCFSKYANFMLQVAIKYKNEVEFAFKPHPLLKNKLEKKWGKEKTDAYYSKWKTLPNTMLQEGDYIDLFLKSDAMIHDSGSFLIEYLYTKKPVMRTMNDVDPKTMYNDFALDALDVYYKAYNEKDIEQFIQNVIDGVDPMKEAREKFYQERLLPPNGKLPSENIVNDIIDKKKKKKVVCY